MAAVRSVSRVRGRVVRLAAAVCGDVASGAPSGLAAAPTARVQSVVAGGGVPPLGASWGAGSQRTPWWKACAATLVAASAGAAAVVSSCSAPGAADADGAASVSGVRPEAIGQHAYDFNWDGCEAEYDAAKAEGRVSHKHASRFVVLMRHGQYESGEEQDERRVLTAKGRVQVAAAANYLQRRLHAHPFTADPGSGPKGAAPQTEAGAASGSTSAGAGGAFWHRLPPHVGRLELVTSSMTRALETSSVILDSELGQLVANRDSVPVHDALREDRPVQHALRMAYHLRKHGSNADDTSGPVPPLPANPKHGDIEDMFFRLLRRPAPDQARHTVTLVSGHANIIRYFVTRAMQVDPSAWISMQLPNASITVVRVMKDGRVFLYNIGDTGGMAAEQGLITYK